MRKPNGYGCIKRLSGNRRRPFVFVISQEGRQKPVEYFASQSVFFRSIINPHCLIPNDKVAGG